MKRKQFLNRMINLSLTISASEFLIHCSSSNTPLKEEVLDTPILQFLFHAMKSPNAHNTQPWKIKLVSETEFLLFADETRLLPETDPTTRQIHISQGTFLESFQISASASKFKTSIQLFPESKYSISQIGLKPVAKVKIEKLDSIEQDILYPSISKRITNRTAYDGIPLTTKEIDEVRKLTNPKFSELNFFNRESLPELKKLLDEAFRIETTTYKKHDESKNWFRFNDNEIYSKKDGISLRGNGLDGFFYTLVSNFFLSKENWHSKSNQESGIQMFSKSLNSSFTFAYLKTNQNDFKDWVESGRDYIRLNLALTQLGFQLHPMSQILQEYVEMKELSKKINDLIGIKKNEKIQMLVRIGKSNYYFQSPRREVKNILIG
jgi:hypothetical protein